MSSLLPVKLPPSGSQPDFNVNASETNVLLGLYDDIWGKGEDGRWHQATEEDKEIVAEYKTPSGQGSNSGPGSDNHAGLFAVSTLFSILLAAVVIGVILFFVIRKYRSSKNKDGYHKAA